MKNSVILESLTQDELKDLISGIFDEKLKSFQPTQEYPDKYLTRQEVATKLRITFPTLHKLTNNGTLIAYRIGGRVLYKKSDVEDSLTEVRAAKHKRNY